MHATAVTGVTSPIGDLPSSQGVESPAGCGDSLVEQLYPQLVAMATRLISSEPFHGNLEGEALAHEAYLRLRLQTTRWRGAGHFLAIAGRIMRRLLIDRARARSARKRGGDMIVVRLDEHAESSPAATSTTTNRFAIGELARSSPELASVALLRAIHGFTLAETATHLGLSESTVVRRWAEARARLRPRMER